METKVKKPGKNIPKVEEMTKEQIRQTILRKRECNAKAQKIVENLLEKCISVNYFLECLSNINQSHFEDVIEERSILHLCGYPLCQKPLSYKDIPKQKYRISMKNNKVYDITTRKCFCSNLCYKSAMHVKKQMLTSPLWFREYEEIPKFNLLPIDSIGSMGQEVDLGAIEKVKFLSEQSTFTSINDFANASLIDIDKVNNNIADNSDSVTNTCDNQPKDINNSKEYVQNFTQDEIIKKPSKMDEKTVVKKDFVSQRKSAKNPLNIVGDVIEKPVKPINPVLINSPTLLSKEQITKPVSNLQKKKQPSIAAIVIEVEKSLAEWFTIDTLLFLFGRDKVKEMITDKGECIKEYLNNYFIHTANTSNTYDQYQELCQKLNMLELQDRCFDVQTSARETKPLPDYSVLKEESKNMQLKVKAFFAGETEIPELNSDDTEQDNVDSVKTQLPLVDKNAQNALRRRIVCEHLNKVLPDMLRSLGLLTLTISSDIRLLVSTFRLKANNIMFKPMQWLLIAIIFIKLLSIRDPRIENLLEQPMAYQHLQLLLLSFKQDGGYLDRLILWLTDVDRLLDVNDNQLTIE